MLVLETRSWQVFNGLIVVGYIVLIQLCVVHCQLNSVSQACHAKMAIGGTRLQRELYIKNISFCLTQHGEHVAL